MMQRLMITLGTLLTVLGARDASAQNCYQCVYDAPAYLCVGGNQFGYRSCQATSGGCILQWQCGPLRPGDAAVAAVASTTGGSGRIATFDRHSASFAVIAVGRRIERGCGGKVVARVYDSRTRQALRAKSKNIVV